MGSVTVVRSWCCAPFAALIATAKPMARAAANRRDLAAGTLARAAQLLVGHPFDTIKVQFTTARLPLLPGTR